MTKDTNPYGIGRRKTAVAQVLLTQDPEKRTVNSIHFEAYFSSPTQQVIAMKPFSITSQSDSFGFQSKIHGGGKHAQSQALQLAIARALLSSNASYRKQLKNAGLLTRDARMKERKKPGLKRARRAPQFSKR